MRMAGKKREARDETALWAREVMERAILTYGTKPQIVVAMEELAELIQALSKYLRAGAGAGGDMKEIQRHIREELADVTIMLNQLEIIFGGSEADEIWKLRRLEERMDRG